MNTLNKPTVLKAKAKAKTITTKDPAKTIAFPQSFLTNFSQRMAPPQGESPLAFILTENTLRGQDLIGIEQLSKSQIQLIIEVALALKANKFDETQTKFAKGQTLALLFEKPSLRTRFTFEAGMTQLGGHAVNMETKLSEREPVFDVAKNLDRWVDGIMARTFSHKTIIELAENASIPVINGLSDREHPCQALADFMTMLEHKGSMDKIKIVFVGDGNNVAQSLMLLAAKVGADFTLACPPGYMPETDIIKTCLNEAEITGSKIAISHEPMGAVYDADVVYTDTWVSMGQEQELRKRELAFAKFQVDMTLLKLAKPDAIVMHCLPAHRGQEVTCEVLDGPQSVIYDQAENRLHAQKAVISLLM
ncbi:MAG: ornithine carbamoyltransferase [Candidatus Obscuribacterales bacterium]|nr:ornithine carbamoyltransferase [Candidatus Obscuribacterales bacterium]